MSEVSVFDNYDPNVSDRPAVGSGAAKMLYMDYGKPLVFKVMANPLQKESNGSPVRYVFCQNFWFEVTRQGKKQRLSRPSLSLLGEEDPQATLVKKWKDNMKKLKEAGNDGTPEYGLLEKMVKAFRASNTVVFLIVQPGSSKVEALSVPSSVADSLFGKPAFGDKPATTGVFQEMKAKGLNPYDLKSNKGWLKLTKTGTQWNDTEYHLVPAKTDKVQVIDGENTCVEVPFVGTVSPELFKITTKDIPDIVKLQAEYAWTAEEISEYLSSKGKSIPDRIINRKAKVEVDETPVERYVPEPEEPVAPKVEAVVEAKVETPKTVKPEPKQTHAQQPPVDNTDIDSLFAM